MKIVILERNSIGKDINLSCFDGLGEIVAYENTTTEQIADRVEDADIVVINKCPMNASTLYKAKKLKLIATLATGYDVIDISYCEEHGIRAANVKGYSTASVAQHTFALALALAGKLAYYSNHVKSGSYMKESFFCHIEEPFYELSGKTWGIAGMGNIGKQVAKIAEAFGCKVIYYSTTGQNNVEGYTRCTIQELCAQSDIISVHCPLTEATRGMVNKQFLKEMKKEAILINVARGPVVVEEDLKWALQNKEIAAAGLDVLSLEPIREDNPLCEILDMENLIITPHMAWASREARQRLVEEVALNIKAFSQGEERNIVTGK